MTPGTRADAQTHVRGLDRSVLAGHLAAGALWLAGASIAMQGPGPVLAAGAAAYVVLGSLALASTALRRSRTRVAWWALAVLLVTAVLTPVAGWWSPVVAVPVGSVVFGTWAVTGVFLTQVLEGGRHPDPPLADAGR